MSVKFATPIKPSMGLMKSYDGVRVGLELEYEGADTMLISCDALATKWTYTHDHSLRSGGVEFVSKPLTIKQLPDALATVKEQINASGCHTSKRCGVHVHLNISDLTWEQLWKIITLYAAVEPYVFKKFADTREDSHFCVPLWQNTQLQSLLWRDSLKLRKGVTKAKRGQSVLAPSPNPGSGLVRLPVDIQSIATAKYNAMNLASIKKFGTLEFRQLPGTVDMAKVERWCRFLMRLREYALTFPAATDISNTLLCEGYAALLPELGLDESADVDPQYVEDAIDAACMVVGHEPTRPEDLDWEIS